MASNVQRFFGFCSLLLALLAVGCGRYDAHVSGIVTLDGQPVDRGNVTFIPRIGGTTSYANIQPDGSYEVMTGEERGLPSGNYQVSIVVNEVIPPKIEGDPPPGAKLISPRKYADPNESGLEFLVERGRNTMDIEMVSDRGT